MEPGKRVMHTFVDFKGEQDPARIFIRYPNSSPFDVWTSVDFRTFKRAVDWMPWWLKELLKGEDSRTNLLRRPIGHSILASSIASSKNASKTGNFFHLDIIGTWIYILTF
jgi:hypothetical protein